MSTSSTVTVTKGETSKLKNKNQDLKDAVTSKDIEDVIEKVKAIDFSCSFTKCKNRTKDFAINCKFCSGRFCTSHGLPEIHGCGEAVKRDERRKMLHPDTKLSQDKHGQAQTKLNMKLKQMQQERKSKLGARTKGKK